MIVRPLPPAVMRNTAPRRHRGRCVARRPFMSVAAPRPKRDHHFARHLLWIVAGILLLGLIPLVVHAQEIDSMVVTWTAEGDDGSIGAATAYDLRFSESPINASNFEAATAVPQVPAPGASGTRQRVTVRGLTRGTTYYLAIRSVDDAGNWSGISNVLRWDWVIDSAPPGIPGGVSVERSGASVRVAWTPGTEPDLRGYNVYRGTQAGGPFTALTATPLSTPEYMDADVPADVTMVWYQVTAVDVAGNESARSAAISIGLTVSTTAFTLESAYPNPSRASDPVQIPIVVPAGASGAAIVDVVDAGGRRVRRLEVSLGPGRQEVEWDGKNDAGRVVAPGVYRAWLIAGGTRTSIRLLRAP